MNFHEEGNPFNDPKTAQDWIHTVEGEKGRVRDQDIYPRLKAWINLVAPQKILEIGSGQGIASDKIDLHDMRKPEQEIYSGPTDLQGHRYSEQGTATEVIESSIRNYIGLDSSPLLIDRAKQLYPHKNRRFVLGNAYALPFSDHTFDAAFTVTVWHLLKDIEKAAKEMSRVLKPSGHFLIISPNPGAYSLWTENYTDTHLEGRRFEGRFLRADQSPSREVLYLHTLDEIKKSLQQADLEIQKTETFRTSEKSKGQEYFISIQGQKSKSDS